MCGIAGIYNRAGGPVDLAELEAMTQAQTHRGPDGEGYVFLAMGRNEKPIAISGSLFNSIRRVPSRYSLGFGHRRLAILDPSPLGHQPMASENGAVWITYNGEIYNYLELGQELQSLGWCFRSRTDTEVVLNAYQQWGMDCLHRLNGMFAFAIWDGLRNQLFCARDRLGMKPFYYRHRDNRFAFGSEIKALLKGASAATGPNEKTIYDFLVFGLQDHSEETFFKDIVQLPPGHQLVVDRDRVRMDQWWDLPPSDESAHLNDQEAIQQFSDLLRDAVRIHLRSDTVVGSCLSGGLDSSSVVCLAADLRRSSEAGNKVRADSSRLKTFSACFEDPRFDERPYLHQAVTHSEADSVEVYPDGRTLFGEMPTILRFQEEPFGGTSYLAQWAVMQTASRHGVKVLLDGQGGDELLCGYPGYWGSYWGDLFRGGAWGTLLKEMRAYRASQAAVHPTVWANLARAVLPGQAVAWARMRMKGHSLWINPEFSSAYADRQAQVVYEQRFPSSLANHMAAYLQRSSLPALLHHEDRNSMAFSIESRLPFLDMRVVEFLVRLPPRLKLQNGLSKVILRQAMRNVLPEPIRMRTDKMGFVTPQDQWLRESWRPDIEGILNERSFHERPYWDSRKAQQVYREYCHGTRQMGKTVWRWISLELWHQQFFQ